MPSTDPRYLLLVAVVGLLLPVVSRGRRRNAAIVLISLGMYAAFNTWHVLLLLYVSAIAYIGARLITAGSANSRWPLPGVIGMLLVPLLIYKYVPGVTASGHDATTALGSVLPIGLSFYTFQAIGYVIDVYVGNTPAERRVDRFAAFMSFFPQLTAGPIERAPHELPQLDNLGVFDQARATSGLRYILFGLLLKVVVADSLAPVVDAVYAAPRTYSGLDIALATFYFSFQVYADFAGYSLIAIGSGRLLGIELLQNFAQPYLSDSLPRFWRSWHISLSGWFRDYVFTPLHFEWRRLGSLGVAAALVVTFLLIGVWHGSGAKYVVFGLLHGALVTAATLTAKSRDRLRRKAGLTGPVWRVLRILITFAIVTLTFILFRAANVREALWMYRALVVDTSFALSVPLLWPLALVLGVVLTDVLATARFSLARLPAPILWTAYHAAVISVLLTLFARFLTGSGNVSYYIYYRF